MTGEPWPDRSAGAARNLSLTTRESWLGSMPILEAWRVTFRSDALGARCLVGLVTGHPLLPGHRRGIQTSPLVRLDLHARIAQTRSRCYRLGAALSRFEPASDGCPGHFAMDGRTIAQSVKDGPWVLSVAGAAVACYPALASQDAIEVLLDDGAWQAAH